ncbi:MAG TPA: aminopeptidase 1 [Vicinamibacteria bacterium]|nr:aminopeptidase 1 [Vicinamibacteria bacterium]
MSKHALILSAILFPVTVGGQQESSWATLTDETRAAMEAHASAYKTFMKETKTELHFVREAVRLAREAGFSELTDGSRLSPGARFYDVNRDRTLTLIVVGQRPVKEGFQVVGAHIDSPRLELKARPLYEKEGFALFQTNYHGGIKTYQWTNLPLALMGRVDLKNGRTVWISVGNEEDQPTFLIADLSPHVDAQLRERRAREAIELEELDPIVGHVPASGAGGVKQAVVEYLRKTYEIELDDLVSAELALVPALAPRDVGFDQGLMAIYGQDDRLSGYAALRAILDSPDPDLTAIAYLVDNEEVGNVNNTGADSTYLVDLMGRLLYEEMGEAFREHWLRRALRSTRVLSSDVNPGINPMWPDAWEEGNAPRLGQGVNLKMYGRGFNANSEYTAWIRKVLDDAHVPWQVATYKVGRAGGGTIGRALADDNMEVIDLGVPVLSIHTPYSVSSKLDVYSLYRAMHAFFMAARPSSPS